MIVVIVRLGVRRESARKVVCVRLMLANTEVVLGGWTDTERLGLNRVRMTIATGLGNRLTRVRDVPSSLLSFDVSYRQAGGSRSDWSLILALMITLKRGSKVST
jgi:hypothetical protein